MAKKEQGEVMPNPNEDRLIVELIPEEEKTPGGLIIPQQANDGKPVKRGLVVAVGPGSTCRHCGLPKEGQPKVGMRVLYPAPAGYTFEWGNKKYCVIRFGDIQFTF